MVNDTFKRQFKLSGVDIGDDRKGTIVNVETQSGDVKTEVCRGLQDKSKGHLLTACSASGVQIA